ncbi:hypothetical protein OIU84_000995 [Salix udensis]|uniref:Protein kinase domain-containing protein n=1 Tax=Salix udensis TaxID=889485 RepID=A0AAD6L5X5_9ROSI|nr:hypothetical protein OIU84_000995 [Salix udensis]
MYFLMSHMLQRYQTLAWRNGHPATGDTYITGQVVGTKGYAAPEYVRDGKLYIKSDVYSFGVVLVEMLTGLRVGGEVPSQTGFKNGFSFCSVSW